jgi:hypothetical protein
MSFAVAHDVEPQEHFRQIAAAMVRQSWTGGVPAGKRPFGVVVHTQAVMAIIGRVRGHFTGPGAGMRGVPLYDRPPSRREDDRGGDQRSTQR